MILPNDDASSSAPAPRGRRFHDTDDTDKLPPTKPEKPKNPPSSSRSPNTSSPKAAPSNLNLAA